MTGFGLVGWQWFTEGDTGGTVFTETIQLALERCERRTESDEILMLHRAWVAATEALLLLEAGLSCTATSGAQLSPTVFRDGEFRFFFFSREESRVHIHVSHPDGEAKFWLKPTIELARNIGLSSSKIKDAERLIKSRQQEITDAWNNHFGS